MKVLVSSSGFTKTALAKAARYGIRTITTREVTPEFVGKVVNNADRAQYWHWITLVQRAEIVITRDGATQQDELPGNMPIFYPDGSQVSVLEVVVRHIIEQHIRDHDPWEQALREKEASYGDGEVKYIAIATAPEPRSQDGQKVYVKGTSHATGVEELFEIANVIVTFEAKFSVADVPLKHGEYDGSFYSTGTAPLGDHNTVQLVYTENADGELDVIGRLDGRLDTLGVQVPPKADEAAAAPSDLAEAPTSPPQAPLK